MPSSMTTSFFKNKNNEYHVLLSLIKNPTLNRKDKNWKLL